MTWLATLACALLATSPVLAASLDVVNALRTGGCADAALASPLRRVAALDEVARRIARGDSLTAALDGAHYRARRSTFVRLGGVHSDAEVERLLRAHHCARIADPALLDAGAARRGDTLWLVLAAPFTAPAPGDAAQIGARVLALVNEARATARRCGEARLPAAAPLAAEARLDAAARNYAQELARLDRFAHQGVDGSTAADRVGRTGYRSRLVGENLAAGPTSAAEVVAGWLASPAHCANLMDARFTQMGIAYAVNTGSTSGVYWVQTLAAPR